MRRKENAKKVRFKFAEKERGEEVRDARARSRQRRSGLMSSIT